MKTVSSLELPWQSRCRLRRLGMSWNNIGIFRPLANHFLKRQVTVFCVCFSRHCYDRHWMPNSTDYTTFLARAQLFLLRITSRMLIQFLSLQQPDAQPNTYVDNVFFQKGLGQSVPKHRFCCLEKQELLGLQPPILMQLWSQSHSSALVEWWCLKTTNSHGFGVELLCLLELA